MESVIAQPSKVSVDQNIGLQKDELMEAFNIWVEHPNTLPGSLLLG